MRLQNSVKSELLRRIGSGESINSISRSLNLGKSTIYYHYRRIKGKKYTIPILPCEPSEIAGEIVGIFAGDGSQYFDRKGHNYKVNVHFGKKNQDYANYVKQLFENFFQKHFVLGENTKATLRLRTTSKDIFNYFKKYLEMTLN